MNKEERAALQAVYKLALLCSWHIAKAHGGVVYDELQAAVEDADAALDTMRRSAVNVQSVCIKCGGSGYKDVFANVQCDCGGDF